MTNDQTDFQAFRRSRSLLRRLSRRVARRSGFFFARHFNPRARAELHYLVHQFNIGIQNASFDHHRNGEVWLLERLAMLRPVVVFDVGAHVGAWSDLAHETFPDATVHAFEVLPFTFQQLQQRMSGRAWIRAQPFGLGEEDGDIEIYPGDIKSVSTAYPPPIDFESYGEPELCPIMRGDSYMRNEALDRIDFLKVDVEGGEINVLKGFGNRLTDVRIIQFEYTTHNIYSRVLLLDLYSYLHSRDFKVAKIYPKHIEYLNYHPAHENFIGGNYVAFQRNDLQLVNLLT